MASKPVYQNEQKEGLSLKEVWLKCMVETESWRFHGIPTAWRNLELGMDPLLDLIQAQMRSKFNCAY